MYDRRRAKKRTLVIFTALKYVFFALMAVALVYLGGAVYGAYNATETDNAVYLSLVNANFILILLCALFIARKVIVLFLERRGRLKGARLPIRLLGIFSVLTVIPALLISAAAIFILNQAIDSWFSRQVNEALEASREVAQGYLAEHERTLLLETIAISRDPLVTANIFFIDTTFVEGLLARERFERGLDALALYDSHGTAIASGSGNQVNVLTTEMLEWFSLPDAKPRAFLYLEDQRLVAAVPMQPSGMWLVASRWVDPSVIAGVNQTEAAYQEYYTLRQNRSELQFIFTFMFILLTMTTLAGAIWAGLRLAGKLVKPITELVHATNRVSTGDMDVRLIPKDDDELGILTQSFNRMTRQLRVNKDLLERKNAELDDRRRTMETLLTGVSAGVVGLDSQGNIRTLNRKARELLNATSGDTLVHVPELAQVYEDFIKHPRDLLQQQVRFEHDGDMKTFLVRLVPQRGLEGKVQAAVMTLDDVTPLISAQKVAAWADVARRLAHEIKNPLTPIQLSAERLKRKYLKQLNDDADKELFAQLTDTIVRQAEEMRRMTNEFSDFARMPAAVMQEHNIVDILDELLVLQRTARPEIEFSTELLLPKEQATILCDRSHVNRALTNILENAVNAIEENKNENRGQGRVKIVVKMSQDGMLLISVQDNGCGLPEEVTVDDLFSPYVTTRKKGTGLGLAIVRRVMDEHEGQVRLQRKAEGGTQVELSFPKNKDKVESHDDNTNTPTT